MYKYEEMDFNEILADPEIDPENAEVMYAIAQCYRHGKGVEADAQKYAEMLQNAADAGSEMAKEEMASLEGEPEKQAEEGEPEVEKDLTKLPMDELMDLVHEDDIRACCEVYRRYGKEESRYLMHAAELIDQGNHSLSKEECQKVLETLAEHYLNDKKDIERAVEAYGKAAELGSAAACWKLAELCGNEQQELYYTKKASEIGTEHDTYRYSELLRKQGRRAEADACLAKLLKKPDLDEALKVRMQIQKKLHSLHGGTWKSLCAKSFWKTIMAQIQPGFRRISFRQKSRLISWLICTEELAGMGIPGMHGCSGQPREEMRKQSQKFRKRQRSEKENVKNRSGERNS